MTKLVKHCPMPGGEEGWPEFLGLIVGGVSLRAWCRERDVAVSSMYEWMVTSGRRAEFDMAMLSRADTIADEICDLADECLAQEDFRTSNQYRVAIDAKKWVAAMLNPKRYGQLLAIEQREPPLAPEKVKERVAALRKNLKLVPSGTEG